MKGDRLLLVEKIGSAPISCSMRWPETSSARCPAVGIVCSNSDLADSDVAANGGTDQREMGCTVSTMRFNHMELSFARGTLTQHFRDDVDAFYCGVLGWHALDTEVVGQSCHLLQPDDGQFILLAEGDEPMSSPGYDHLGLLMESRDEVDATLAECRRFQEKDERLRIKEYEDLNFPGLTVHAFYVKHLLPIWFDVQCMEWPAGMEPPRRWQYS